MAAGVDVYVYGMTVWSTVHLLSGPYPVADTYGEILETHQFPGGEAGNAALLLSTFGYLTALAGPYLGTKTRDPIIFFYAPYSISCDELAFDGTYEGVQDLVLVGEGTRTVFGRFAQFFRGPKRWSPPCMDSVRAARMVLIDPFFGTESVDAASLCVRHGKPYVTIDCPCDSYLHRHSAATIVSSEYLAREAGTFDRQANFMQYTEQTRGLVVFTSGSKEILYGRRRTINRLQPFQVDVRSTLGAGDTFRAGLVHGLLSGMDDRQAVTFAAATAACVCRRFPFAFDPPSLQEIAALADTA